MVEFSKSNQEKSFAEEVRTWLEEHLVGEFSELRNRGGTGREDIPVEILLGWEKELATGGWLGLDFPEELGGRNCSLFEQVIFHQTYVEARAPGRIPNIGVTLLAPTLVAYGTHEQQARFIPEILKGNEFWCQGYSEPDAGSDLANISTRATKEGDQWIINGQKIWTSLAQYSDWIFVLCRTDMQGTRHQGLSYLLAPMKQDEIEIRPIVQITGGSEFNEVFFNNARTEGGLVVGESGGGWSVAMGTLAFERGASTLGQQTAFSQELDELIQIAKQNGAIYDPVVRQELAKSFSELQIMRYNQMRMLSSLSRGGVPGPEMSIGKLYWASWHRRLGELGIRIRGSSGMVGVEPTPPLEDSLNHGYLLDSLQRTFLYSRAHTIYAGSNQVQRNIIGERVLGLPREPREG